MAGGRASLHASLGGRAFLGTYFLGGFGLEFVTGLLALGLVRTVSISYMSPRPPGDIYICIFLPLHTFIVFRPASSTSRWRQSKQLVWLQTLVHRVAASRI